MLYHKGIAGKNGDEKEQEKEWIDKQRERSATEITKKIGASLASTLKEKTL